MKVFAFLYNPMVEESSYGTVSLHKTRKGAEVAMAFHKQEKYKKFVEFDKWRRKEYGKNYESMKTEFGNFEDWAIDEIEIKE